MLFNTSSVSIARLPDDASATIAVAPAPGDKCPRCWRFVPEIAEAGDVAGLCLRCVDAVGRIRCRRRRLTTRGRPTACSIPPAGLEPPAGIESRAARWATRPVRLYWWLSLVVIAADQTAKFLVQQRLNLFDSVTIIPGFLALTHVENRGVAAFGLLNDVNLPFKWV